MIPLSIALVCLGALAWDAWRRWLARDDRRAVERIGAVEQRLAELDKLQRDLRETRDQLTGLLLSRR